MSIFFPTHESKIHLKNMLQDAFRIVTR